MVGLQYLFKIFIHTKVLELSKKFPKGGESYFNNLDNIILNKETTFVLCNHISSFFKAHGYIILGTGKFGSKLLSKGIVDFTFEGGLRKYKSNIKLPKELVISDKNKYLLIDDSYYSGNTAKSIFNAINAKVKCIYCIYDGSKKISEDVYSIFRYYDNFKNKENEKQI